MRNPEEFIDRVFPWFMVLTMAFCVMLMLALAVMGIAAAWGVVS